HYLPRLRIQRVHILSRGEEDTLAGGWPAVPIRDAAMAHLAKNAMLLVWIEAPFQLARCGIQRDDAQLWRGGIKNAIDHDWIALQLGTGIGIAGIKAPGDLQLRYV